MKLPTLLLLLPALACTPKAAGIDTAEGEDTSSDDTSTTDSADPEVAPVWREFRLGTSATLQGVYASGQGVYVVGTDGHAFVGSANDPWVPMDPPVGGVNLTDLWGQGADDALVLQVPGAEGLISTYTPSGWAVEDLGTANHEAIGGSGPGALFAVGFGGVFYNGSGEWTFETLPGNVRLNDIYAVGGSAIAVGEAGVILRRDETTGTWVAMESPTLSDLNAVAGSSPSDVWAVGADGVALRFDGTVWSQVDTGVSVALWALFAPTSDAVFAAGNNGVALRWNGEIWESLPTGVANNLYALHGVSAANVWAVGNRGTALQYKQTGG
jgi:hypothetical protein